MQIVIFCEVCIPYLQFSHRSPDSSGGWKHVHEKVPSSCATHSPELKHGFGSHGFGGARKDKKSSIVYLSIHYSVMYMHVRVVCLITHSTIISCKATWTSTKCFTDTRSTLACVLTTTSWAINYNYMYMYVHVRWDLNVLQSLKHCTCMVVHLFTCSRRAEITCISHWNFRITFELKCFNIGNW